MKYVLPRPTPYKPLSWSLLFVTFPRQNWRRLLFFGTSGVVLVGSLKYGYGPNASQPPLVSFLISAFYVGAAIFLMKYLSQTTVEMQLCYSVISLSRLIRPRSPYEKKPSNTKVQSAFESVRRNLHEYAVASTATIPAINDFVFEKLQNHIDVFFYAAGMVLFAEKPDYYSSSEERQMEMERDWEEASWNEEKEFERQAIEAEQSYENVMSGIVTHFDIHELRSFCDRLGTRMFRVSNVHPFLGFKYSVNVVDLMKFFEYWITTLSGCDNVGAELSHAKEDVKQFYSKLSQVEEKKKERSWALIQGLVIAVFSAFVVYIMNWFK